MKYISLVMTMVMAASSSSCATIVKGTSQLVSIDSNVSGAEVVVDGSTVGSTPYNGPIKRGSSTTVTVKKQGYRTKTLTLNTEVEPIFFGNIIFGGFIGSTTDLASQSMYKYSPSTIQVDLQSDTEKK